MGTRGRTGRRRWIGVAVRAALLCLGLGVSGAAPAAIAADLVPRDTGAALRAIETAVGRGDLATAERLRWDLHSEALASRRWEASLASGHAALAIGRGAPDPTLMRATARRAYLAALFQARGRRSLDGVLLAAEAFARLGDRDVVEGALRIAERLPGAANTPEIKRIRLTAHRLHRLTQHDNPHGRIDP